MDHKKFLQKEFKRYGQEVIFPNIRTRLEYRQKAEIEPKLGAVFAEKFRRDILWAFKYWFWVKEPRPHYLKWYGLKNANLPFVLYPAQEEFVLKVCEHIEAGKNLLLDKTREQGATWMMMCIILWYWLKKESGNDFLVVSRKEVNVDKKGAQDTLFAKLRYNIDFLPDYLMPEGFDYSKHDKVTLLTNPVQGNAINGEANNPNVGTSGRYKLIFGDEYAKWEENDETAFTSMQSSSPCVIVVSTPFGMGRKFSRLRFDGSIAVHSLHWSDHPLHGAGNYEVEQHPYLPEKKNVLVSPWYLLECERRKGNPEADIGQELDMDHLTAGTPYFKSQAYYIQEQYKSLEGKDIGKRFDFLRAANDQVEIFESSTGRITIVENEVPGWQHRYGISADVAEGLEHGDNSVFYLYDRVTGFDVAWFVGKVDTYVFALLLAFFGNKYDQAFIAVESNNQGSAVLQGLKYNYPCLYHNQDYSTMVDVETTKLGHHTNVKTKPIMCDKLRQALTDEVEGVLDKDFYSECQTFVTHPKTGKLGATEGNHDDRVISQSIKWILHDWLPAPRELKQVIDPFEGQERFGGVVLENQDDNRRFW